MNRIVIHIICAVYYITFLNAPLKAQDYGFKLFEKSEKRSGFGGLMFNMHQGQYFMTGGQGAGVFGNFYFGGFGYRGSIGNYTFPLSNNEYRLTKRAGGLMVGGVSNPEQILAVYADLKFSWDKYLLDPIDSGLNLEQIEYRSVSLMPSIGLGIRPASFIQVRIGAGYNYSGVVDDGGLENVPYNAGMLNVDLVFGSF